VPASKRFRVSSALVRRVEDLGVPPAVVLRHAGLPVGLFSEERILLTTEELFALYRGLALASDDPAFGLKLGTVDRIERYDPVAIAALYAKSFRDALERIARYKLLTCPEEIHITERKNEVHVEFEWLLAEEDEPPLLIDVCFAWLVEIARRATANVIKPKRIELVRSEGNRSDRKMFERHFGCAIEIRARKNVLVFDREHLDRPFVTHNPEVLAIVAPPLEAEVARQRRERSIREQVKGTLKKTLAGQRPELSVVARELGMSTRTLQRRLTDERATFQRLISEARHELACHYLRHASLELNETAYLLGYEDANSFFRAFQQWEGTSPGAWRAEMESSRSKRRATR
jgi:AraC-like DNA-binding protein